MATYDLTSTTPSKIKIGDILNCPYSGSAKSITLPKGQYKLECWGAQGGNAGSYQGGYGGYSTGTLTLSDKTIIYLQTGGQGSSSSTAGGYNGGGAGVYSGRGGGGASDIRIGQNSLYARVLVAGAGGGSGVASGYSGKGVGGGTSGLDGYSNNKSTTGANRAGGGGSQTVGGISWQGIASTKGSFGQGGPAYMYSCGGGGGGWYGGGGAYDSDSDTDGRNGGGGSGYIYTSSTASNYPSGCLLNSSYYLSNASTVAGNTSFTSPTGTSETGHTGNGYIRITVLDVQSGNTLIKIPSSLPSTYSQLEYLQLTGSQYINTGVTVDSNTGFDITFEPLNGQSSSPYYNLFGVRGNDSSGGTSETQNYFRIDTIPVDSNTGTEFKYGTTIYNSGIKNTSKINIKLINKVYTKPDGSTITLSGNITSGLAMYIGCINKDNTPYGNKASMKIYRFKIYSGSTLTNDYIPALRISDNVSGLYDIKTNTFKTDAAGGTFTNGGTINPWKNAKQIFVNTGSSSTIPSGLVELDYIKPDSTQYINTQFIPTGNTRIIFTFEPTVSDNQALYCGGRTAASGTDTKTFSAFYISKAIRRDYYGTSKTTTTTYDLNTKITVDANKNTTLINNSSALADFTLNTSTTSTMPVILFIAANQSSSAIVTSGSGAQYKFYSCKIYDNGTLVRDFIPAKRTSDGKCGLWDKVNYKFYTDENGGNFTAGTEKSTIAAVGTAIEYLESSGTQYIDTNILGQNISKVNVDFQFTSVPSGAEAQIAAIYASSAVYFQIGWSGSSFMRTSEYTYSQTANSLARTQTEGAPTGRPAYNLWLFGQNETGTLKHPASAKIYSCKIYNNSNILVRDFIPIKTTTNIYGLWDKVNKTFYPNAGTGTFTGGSTVSLSGWREAKGMWVKTASGTWTQVL